ncbi:MAG: ParB/RepB/Spo0J family partition protein [Pyrinomonadaceae bacterium]
MARQTLGRGLSALLGEDTDSNESPRTVPEIDIDLIKPNPQQPRTRFAEKELDQLAQSISANGVVQPIVVRPSGRGFEIVAGERRWRAAQRAGLRKIPAAVREVPDEKLLELALIENIQRQELNPIEEAAAYRRLIETLGMTQEMVAERVGKERSLVATSLRLLKLPSDIQKLIEDERLSAGHGRALLMTDDPALQRRLARQALEKNMSVRETERSVKAAGSKKLSAIDTKITVAKDPNITAAETKLRRLLGTSVNISKEKKGEGGKIEIAYFNDADLDRIYRLIVPLKS